MKHALAAALAILATSPAFADGDNRWGDISCSVVLIEEPGDVFFIVQSNSEIMCAADREHLACDDGKVHKLTFSGDEAFVGDLHLYKITPDGGICD